MGLCSHRRNTSALLANPLFCKGFEGCAMEFFAGDPGSSMTGFLVYPFRLPENGDLASFYKGCGRIPINYILFTSIISSPVSQKC